MSEEKFEIRRDKQGNIAEIEFYAIPKIISETEIIGLPKGIVDTVANMISYEDNLEISYDKSPYIDASIDLEALRVKEKCPDWRGGSLIYKPCKDDSGFYLCEAHSYGLMGSNYIFDELGRIVGKDDCKYTYRGDTNVVATKEYRGCKETYDEASNLIKKEEDGKLQYEKLPDCTERKWYKNGQMESEKLPDGTCFKYDEHGKITYHATKGIEDTVVYLAKERVEKRKEEKLAKLEGKPKVIQKIAGEITSTKAFNDIALKIATKKVKKDLGK